jgi:hypothetical protein
MTDQSKHLLQIMQSAFELLQVTFLTEPLGQ